MAKANKIIEDSLKDVAQVKSPVARIFLKLLIAGALIVAGYFGVSVITNDNSEAPTEQVAPVINVSQSAVQNN